MTTMFPKTDDTNFAFDVARERLLLANGGDTGMDALWRKDSGSTISVVSPRYKFTAHKDANAFVEGLLADQSINYEIGKTAVSAGGARFFREFRFPDMKFVPGEGVGNGNQTALDGGQKDVYVPTIVVRNSYDKSSALDFMYGGFRMVCSNGMVVGNIVDRFQIRHVLKPDFSKIGDGLVDKLEMTIEGFKRTYDTLNSQTSDPFLELLLMETFTKKMTETLVLMSEGLITLDYDKEGKIIEGVTASPELSAYALLQLATNVATHSIRKYHRSLDAQKKIAKVFNL